MSFGLIRRIVSAVPILCFLSLYVGGQDANAKRWFRGNTHAHTTNSDGDSSPEEVANWYREHGYDFLFITDHHLITDVTALNKLSEKFLLIPGQEVGDNRLSYVHVNSLNATKVAEAQKGSSASEVLQRNIDAITSAGGVAQINHPNFIWALTAQDIVRTKGATLLEVLGMQPRNNNYGGWSQAPSTEEMWDQILSKGIKIWGVASDDVHKIKDTWAGLESKRAGAGLGWIMVRAARLSVEEVMSAIRNGDFYASTGVTLQELAVNPKQISVKVVANTRFRFKYRIQFIGKGGKILNEQIAPSATYRINGKEGYVRIRITDSNGDIALTQPMFLSDTKRDTSGLFKTTIY